MLKPVSEMHVRASLVSGYRLNQRLLSEGGGIGLDHQRLLGRRVKGELPPGRPRQHGLEFGRIWCDQTTPGAGDW